MKRNILIYIAAALALVLSPSCDRTHEYEPKAYATLYKTSFSVPENCGELKIPVLLCNSDGSDVQVSVAIKPGVAVENVDFEMTSPAILNFSGDVDSLDIVIAVTNFAGDFTGAKDFSIEISSLTEGVLNGNFLKAGVTIEDLDHPLAPIIGTWTGEAKEEFTGSSVTMSYVFAADPEDFTKLLLTTADPVIGIEVKDLKADAELAADGTGRIVVKNEQPLGVDLNAGPGMYCGFNATTFDGASDYSDIVMVLDADGILTVPNGYGILDDEYIYGAYIGGFTLTKE